MNPEDLIQVSETRRATRYVALRPIRGTFGPMTVHVLDLCEGGFQISHSESLKIAGSATLNFDNPKTFETLEFRSKVVWSRLSTEPSPDGKLLYRSGLRIEAMREDTREALKRLLMQFARPDLQSLEKKRKKVFEAAKKKATQPVMKIQSRSQIAEDQLVQIRKARKILSSNPVEALRWYNRAKFSLSSHELRTIESMRLHYREDVLAVWEYLDRKIPLPMVARAFADEK
ncbi:MAG: PilZ domain-containing protein [Acidobacteriota bacterium]